MAITAVGMLGIRAILGGLPKGSDLQFTILAVTATVAVAIARKYLDRKSFTSLGLTFDKFAVLDVLYGIVNSALVMAGIYFAMLWANLIEFHGFSVWVGSASPNLISQSPVGPEWLSGGAFGAEGSVLIIPFTILSLFLIHYWVRATRQAGQKPFESIIPMD